jgi:hypothetical protein
MAMAETAASAFAACAPGLAAGARFVDFAGTTPMFVQAASGAPRAETGLIRRRLTG